MRSALHTCRTAGKYNHRRDRPFRAASHNLRPEHPAGRRGIPSCFYRRHTENGSGISWSLRQQNTCWSAPYRPRWHRNSSNSRHPSVPYSRRDRRRSPTPQYRSWRPRLRSSAAGTTWRIPRRLPCDTVHQTRRLCCGKSWSYPDRRWHHRHM